MKTVSEQIGEYAASLQFSDIPSDVVHRCKSFMIDTFGCALGGTANEPARIARKLATAVTSTQPATLLGTGEKSSLELAAFANGVMIRYLDFNDGYTSKESGHPSDSIAALLSAGEIAHVDGRELITATLIAYEVFCRLCDGADLKPHGFDHVTNGAIASAAGAGRLLGLSAAQISEAVNLTVAANTALFQTRIGNVSMWKGCAYANTSRNALFAVQLAKEGMTGPRPVFEGKGGYFHAVSHKPFELEAFGGGAQPFKIMDCLIKKYPLGQYSQSVVDAALQLHQRLGGAKKIASVDIRTLKTALVIMADDPEKWRPSNRESADHSIPYTAAVALTYGTIDENRFDDPYLHDPELLDLVSRIKCTESEEANSRSPRAMLCDIDVELTDGSKETVRVEHHRGHPLNPMSDAEYEAKFSGLASTVMSKQRSDRLLEQLWRLDSLADVGTLFELSKFN